MCTNRDKHRIEAAGLLLREQVLDLVVEHDSYAHLLDAANLSVEDVARQTIFRDTEMHHAAGRRTCLVYLDVVTQAGEVVGRRQAARTGADDQHTFAGTALRNAHLPAVLERLITEKALDCMDTDGRVQPLAIALILAGVITDPPVHARHRVIRHE